jgi:hypothetical protein
MKTEIYLNKSHLSVILIMMFWFVGLNSVKAQWNPIMRLNGSKSNNVRV